MKKCSNCKQEKALLEFPPNKSKNDGLNKLCRVCYNEYSREWYQKNKEIHKNRVNARKLKIGKLELKLQKYNLSKDTYLNMLSRYNGKCWICKEKDATSIDHDHSCCSGTNSCGNCVRGILCNNCNSALGYVADRVDILNNAIFYLKRIDV
jgi:hypothetical protein